MTTLGETNHRAEAERQAHERRIIRRVVLMAFPLFLAVFVVMPGGPMFRTFTAASQSMAPTISRDGFAFVSRLSYGYSRYSFDWPSLPISGRWLGAVPERGDIIAFRLPKNPSAIYLKRVIGLAGDTIEMRDGILVINGTPVTREQTDEVELTDADDESKSYPAFIETLPNGVKHRVLANEVKGPYATMAARAVPNGHVFVMGDNRDNSLDSRAGETGPVPLDHIIGKALIAF